MFQNFFSEVVYMANIGCKIVMNFPRPSQELVEKFRGLPVANIDDCMNRTAAVRPEICPLNSVPLLGVDFTVKVAEGANLMFHKAMDLAQPGDVIVIDAGGDVSRSIFGEIMAQYCKTRGVAGLMVDGSVRDRDELAAMDMPIYARGATPNGPYKNGPGEIGTTISFGGIVVRPGDIVIGDGDGALFIHPKEAEELAAKARATSEKEAVWIENIKKTGKFDRPWVDVKLKEIGCEIVE